MSATISSISYYKLGNHGSSHQRSQAPVFSPYCLPVISSTKHGYWISATQGSHQFNINHRLISKRSPKMKMSASNNSQPGAPPESPWNKWILGLMLPLFLPFLRNKGSLLSTLQKYVDEALGRVESVAEVVEVLAEEVEKVAEEVEAKLPDDANLKKTLDSVEDLAKKAVKKADEAEEIIQKVKEVEEELMEAKMDIEKAAQSKSPKDPDALEK